MYKATVYPAFPFDANTDAATIRDALSKEGNDKIKSKDKLIEILCHRSAAQRVQIANAYKTCYGQELVKKLEKKLSKNFLHIMQALCTPLPKYLARELNRAIIGAGTKESILIEILCSRKNAEINLISTAYRAAFEHTLETDIADDTSGLFKTLLVTLAQGRRQENLEESKTKAKEDAQKLIDSGVASWGSTESAINQILISSSWVHICQVDKEYRKLNKDDMATGTENSKKTSKSPENQEESLESLIRSGFSGDVAKTLIAIVKCAQNRPAFFAECIHETFNKFFTDYLSLTRLIVSRCDEDLESIKEEYLKLYNKPLAQEVDERCKSNDHYKATLLALIK